MVPAGRCSPVRRHLTLLLVLVLFGSLAVAVDAVAVASAVAAPSVPQPTAGPVHAEPEEEGFEEGGESEGNGAFEGEGCEAEAFEFESEEEAEAEEEEFEPEAEECGEGDASKAAAAGSVSAPAACLIRHAESTVATLPGSDLVRLTVRYETWSPTAVAIGLKLKDDKGSLALGHATRHLGAHGILHIATRLQPAAMERAERAHEYDVSLHAPSTPGFCGDLLEQGLHASGGAPKVGAARVYGAKRGG